MFRNIVLRGAAALFLTFGALAGTDLYAQKYTTGGTDAAPAPSAPAPNKGKTNTPAKTATNNKAEDFKVIEMVGYLAGNSMYNMYLTIGMTMDLFVAEKYEESTATALLGEQIVFADGCIERFTKMRDSGDFAGEEDAANSIISVYKGLKKQAEWGKKYAASSSESDGAAFESQRVKNWAAIKELMGIE